MIKILLLTISFFLLIFFESFLFKAFSFSIFVIIAVSMWKRIGSIWYFIFLFIGGITLDIVFHQSLGLHTLVLSILLIFLWFLWLIVPRESWFGYIPILVFVFLYYLLLLVLGSLLQDSVVPQITLGVIGGFVVKSIISVLVCMGIDSLFVSVRDVKGQDKIRLR